MQYTGELQSIIIMIFGLSIYCPHWPHILEGQKCLRENGMIAGELSFKKKYHTAIESFFGMVNCLQNTIDNSYFTPGDEI